MTSVHLAQAVELEGSMSISPKRGRSHDRFHPVIRLEQTTYGPGSNLVRSLQAAYGGFVGIVTPRPQQRSVLDYWSVANAMAGRAIVQMFPHLTFKRSQARLVLCLTAAVRQRPHNQTRLTPGANVHAGILSLVMAMLNAGNVDRRKIPGMALRFLKRYAPDYTWLHNYVFGDVIDRHLESGGDIDIPYLQLDDQFNRLSADTQAPYLRHFVDPATRLDKVWVKRQDWGSVPGSGVNSKFLAGVGFGLRRPDLT